MDRKISQALMLGGSLVLSLAATQAVAATGTACSAGVGTQLTGNTSNFVKVTFTPKCSANTAVNYNDSGDAFAVQGASTGGKITYGASTNGGAPTACSTATSGTPNVGASPNITTGC